MSNGGPGSAGSNGGGASAPIPIPTANTTPPISTGMRPMPGSSYSHPSLFISTITSPIRSRSSFAAIAAAPPSPTNTTTAARRPSVPASPSPRIHRISGSFHWAMPPSMHQPATFTGGHPSSSSGAPLLFLRPPYLEHSAFRHLFKQDMFSRNAQPPAPPPLSTPSSSRSAPSSRDTASATAPAPPTARRINPYTSAYMLAQSGASTPSPGESDNEDNDYSSLPTARPRYSNSNNQTQKEKIAIRPEEESFSLPTRWNDADRHASLQISPDGRDLTFLGHQGHGTNEKEDAASARTNNPISPACGIYYYEVEILNRGAKGHIGLGFATKYAKISKLPGWEQQSWGYHGDDGNAFYNGQKKNYGPRFSTGDVVGCGVDFSTPKLFYTKNGALVGDFAFDLTPAMTEELYPFVGLRSLRESVQTNFGQHVFRFDIESYVLGKRNEVWKDIQNMQVEWTIDSQGVTSLKASASSASEADDAPTADNENTSNGTGKFSSSTFALPAIPTSSWSLVHESYMAGEIPPSSSVTGSEVAGDNVHAVMKELVLEYLIQSGYPGSARVFKAQCDSDSAAAERANKDVEDADLRRLGSKWVPGATSGPLKQGGNDQNGDTKMANNTESLLRRKLSSSSLRPIGEGMDLKDAVVRRRVMDAIRMGNVDSALRDLETYYPLIVMEGPSSTDAGGDRAISGGVRFQLRCRKLVEMVLEAAAESAASPRGNHLARQPSSDAMDIDSFVVPTLSYKQKQKQRAVAPLADSTSMMDRALEYGQSLHADYGSDKRPQVQALLKRTSSLVAYVNPLDVGEAGEEVVRFAGQEAREALADRVNEAILELQRRKKDSALERMYAQATGVVRQLAVMAEGKAAFADVEREFR